jgi:hypothetical protein
VLVKLFNWEINMFGNKNVDSVLKSVTNAIDALRDIASVEQAKAENKREVVVSLQEEMRAHTVEADRATALATKFADFIYV